MFAFADAAEPKSSFGLINSMRIADPQNFIKSNGNRILARQRRDVAYRCAGYKKRLSLCPNRVRVRFGLRKRFTKTANWGPEFDNKILIIPNITAAENYTTQLSKNVILLRSMRIRI